MRDRRTRILLVTRNLPPLVGGMERLNWHMVDELARKCEVHVIGPKGAADFLPENIEVTEVPLRPLWRFLVASFFRAFAVSRRFKPDFVIAGSGLTAPAVVAASKISSAKSVAYLHGLDVTVRSRIYRALWHPAIRRASLVIANSEPTARLAAMIGVLDSRIQIVHPGVNIPFANQSIEALNEFRRRNSLEGRSILLSVGRLTTRKGLLEFVEYSLPEIVKRRGDVILVVIGDEPANSLRAPVQTKESIQAAADAAGVGRYVRFLGAVSDFELECAYGSASVHVFPVRSIPGDPEGFGMVAIEAAAHGVPTVAFASGGVIDAVSEGESGNLIEQGDYGRFAEAVVRCVSDGKDTWQLGAKNFAEDFAWVAFGECLQNKLRSIDVRRQR